MAHTNYSAILASLRESVNSFRNELESHFPDKSDSWHIFTKHAVCAETGKLSMTIRIVDYSVSSEPFHELEISEDNLDQVDLHISKLKESLSNKR